MNIIGISMDDAALEKELQLLAEQKNASIHEISPADIVVSEWVRWKCQFGCKGYAKHLSCPPYVPGPERTRLLLNDYRKAYIVHFKGIPGMKTIDPDRIPEDWHPYLSTLILWVHDTMYALEQHAFYLGYYKSLAFAALPCIYCEECVAEEVEGIVDLSLKKNCRHAEKVRTSMEGAGIDVFATVRKIGLPIDVIPCKDEKYGMVMHPHFNIYGLLLVY